ncbi:sugar phosphate nucleotidyltransferase [Rapidithrix thailandica]|uniref:Sugar phosphate nucleotidyltransferase n=1 Tax=Rapidithrix thailandica TaxID=413964 RepID=A0AAW9S3Q9_9BACT
MKVIIPVAGVGTKLRPHTYTQPKAMVPVAGKPIISHIVDFLMQGGLRDFVFIIGYMGDRIKKFMLSNYKDAGIKMHFVVQDPRKGSAHAIHVAEKFFKEEEEILISLGDKIHHFDLKSFLQLDYTAVGVKKVENPRLFGIIEMGKDQFAKKFTEKPLIPKSNLGLVGIYKIKNVPRFIEAINYLIKHQVKTLDEFHLTDALMHMVNLGERICTMEVDGWYDCGKKETLLEANAILLNRPGFRTSDYNGCPYTIIIQPVRIGKNCDIQNSIIGPNVVVGDDTHVHSCTIRNSIIGSFSELDNLILDNSLIGNDSSLKGASKSLNVGDNTQINLGG